MTEITFGCLIDACVKCNYTNKALELIEKHKNLPMNIIIFTTIIKGFTKERNLEKALKIFE